MLGENIMKKVIVKLIGIMLILTPLVALVEPIAAESVTTWYVPGDFSSIQEALTSYSVNSGDTIYVKNGTYYGGFYVSKALTIVGENRDNTIIDLKHADFIQTCTGDITIKNFTIINGYNPPDYAGYYIYLGGSHNIITGNKIIGDIDGIFIWGSSYNTITDNIIEARSAGIKLINSNNNSIKGNTLRSFIFLNGNDNTITGNTCGLISINGSRNSIKDNNVDIGGISLTSANDNTISDNMCKGTITLDQGSNNNSIKDNTITSNFGVSLRSGSNDNTITGNIIKNCIRGIEIIESNKNSIQGNTITGKKIIFRKIKNEHFGICGIRLERSSDNTVGGTEASSKNQISHVLTGIYFIECSYSRITLRKDNSIRNTLIHIAGLNHKLLN